MVDDEKTTIKSEKSGIQVEQPEKIEIKAEIPAESPEDITNEAQETEAGSATVSKESETEKLAARIQELSDQNLRQYAEFDNYRKRTQREKQETYKTAVADCALEFIAVLDNLERAVESTAEESEIKAGVEMIVSQFAQILEKMGVKPIVAENEQFNPELHNAVNQIEDERYGENMVCQVLQKGYQMGKKVLRPAMVVVANP